MRWKKIDPEDPSTFPVRFQDVIFTDGEKVYCGWRETEEEETLEFMNCIPPLKWPENVTHWMAFPELPNENIIEI